jgi:hypothetical protein
MKTKHIPRVPVLSLTCKGKVPLTNFITAMEARDRLAEKIPQKEFCVYNCPHCGEYHVGGVRHPEEK